MQDKQDGKFRKKVSFAAVSNIALRDENLSLKAKGLYALIQSYITLENFTLYKSYLKSLSTDGLRSFNTAWEELKEFGYLKQLRIRDENGFRYEYELLDEPDTETPATINIKLDGTISEKDQLSHSNVSKTQETENKSVNKTADKKSDETYEQVLSEVNENIKYDAYILDDNISDTNKNFVTNIRDIIVEVLLSPKKTIRIGNDEKNSGEVRATLKRFNHFHLQHLIRVFEETTESISNPKAYMLASIYNAVKTIGITEKLCGWEGTY